MLDTLKKLNDLLEPRARRRMFLLLGMIAVLGFMEMAGVGSIMPFVAVLGTPKIIETNRYLFHLQSVGLGIVVFAVVLSSTAFRPLPNG